MNDSLEPADASEHYFTAQPVSNEKLRPLHTRLAGRDVELVTAAGIFSPNHLDTGTKVLLRKVPAPPVAGNLLDIGCGWGPIALTLGMLAPQARVWAVDINERALDLVRRNAQRVGLDNLTAARPEDIPPELKFSAIWSNPPVRIGKQEMRTLVTGWLERLTTDGAAWLVIQRNLGADSFHRWLTQQGWHVTRAGSAKGFRVLTVRHGTQET